jgi:DNA repair protein RecN (Recombination protein N)
LSEPTSLLEPAAIQLDEASRALREYRRRLDLDPDELARVEQRLSAIHDLARKHRVKPEALHALTETLARRLAELSEAADARALAEAAGEAANHYDALAAALTAKRTAVAKTLTRRVTATMKELAMTGGRFEALLEPLPEPAPIGRESLGFRIATHPRQEPGPLSRVASGGELSRVALAIHVAASEVGNVPTLVFDEVDTGIGGAVAATVGRMLQVLGARRQVLCVTHLPQVAAHADHQFRVSKSGDRMQVTTSLASVDGDARVDELARMLAGSEITTKTRAHARELFERHRRKDATLGTEQ